MKDEATPSSFILHPSSFRGTLRTPGIPRLTRTENGRPRAFSGVGRMGRTGMIVSADAGLRFAPVRSGRET
jgi:hypothetical protein